MKKLFTLLALVLCSCAETFVGEEIARPNSENLPDLTAAFAEEGDTRTYIENGKYLRWCEDDRLTIFFGNTLNRQYKFNGQTGDNSGTFSLVPDGMLGTGNAFDRIYALYPYNADARISDEGVISLTLPTTQTYAENSFGVGANTMVAVTKSLDDTFLAFKNVGGYLKLKLYNTNGAMLKSIEVKGNNGEKLAGEATLTINFGETPTLTMAESATDTIALDCGEGVALGTTAETATELWVVLPATTFTNGLTITATDTDDNVFKKSTTKEVVIERNAIQPMAALNARFLATKPVNNEIWYTNGSITEATAPYKTNVFGANIVSNTYDTEKECWVIEFDGDVTTIGMNAFRNCRSLTSVAIPDSVMTIQSEAFYGCSSLIGITISNSVNYLGSYAFYDCSSLTSVTIPDSVTAIGYSAFENCCNLISTTIGDSVTKIEGEAFAGCSSLTSITIPDSVTIIGDGAFGSCSSLISVTIGDSVTTIGEGAFYNCSSLTSVTIPDSVFKIGERAFCRCNHLIEFNGKYASEDGRCLIINGTLNSFAPAGLTEYAIPDSVTTIRGSAFSSCSSLTSVTIGDSVTTIGDSAFYNCTSLTSITIPDSVTEIGQFVFEGCSNLTSVAIGNSVTEIGYQVFYNCSNLTSVTIGDSVTTIGVEAFRGCDSLASIIIPDGVTVIGSYAFSSCDSLTSVTIPDSVTKIVGGAFYGCSSLTSVTIPNSVTSIGYSAFQNCSNLTSVTIGDSVTSIDFLAFYGCSSLTSVYCKATTPPVGGNQMFHNNASGRKIYVPAESIEAYRSAEYWSEYASDIEMWYIPTECTSLTITADDVTGDSTYTTIYYTANTNGVDYNSNYITDITITGTVQSESFPQNSSSTDSVERMIEYTYLGQTATTTIIQTPFIECGYTILLNDAWRQSTSVSNPDSSLYDGVYESFSNYNVNSGVATMYIDITGYTEFSIYIRSDAESTYDYVTVSELDSTTQKMSTSGNQNSGTAISNYTKVTYTGIDGGSHRITVTYRKDGSVNKGADRGYLIIPKNQ